MAPHSGVGGCTPRPRNESPAADNIAVAMNRVVFTMIGDMMFGRICWKMIFPFFAPSARMASTYSSFFVVSVEPRTILAKWGTAPIAMAIVTLKVLPPSTLTIARARSEERRVGKERRLGGREVQCKEGGSKRE